MFREIREINEKERLNDENEQRNAAIMAQIQAMADRVWDETAADEWSSFDEYFDSYDPDRRIIVA